MASRLKKVRKGRSGEEANPTSSRPPENPRGRVVTRMRALMAAGVAAGGMVLSTAHCSSDWMPPPIECNRDPTSFQILQSCASVEASWALLGEDWRIRVRVALDINECRQTTFELAGGPVIQGGERSDLLLEQAEMTFLLQPYPEAQAVDVDVPILCDAHALDFRFRLEVGGLHTEGQEVPITPLD